jgi:hypothetical protein
MPSLLENKRPIYLATVNREDVDDHINITYVKCSWPWHNGWLKLGNVFPVKIKTYGAFSPNLRSWFATTPWTMRGGDRDVLVPGHLPDKIAF